MVVTDGELVQLIWFYSIVGTAVGALSLYLGQILWKDRKGVA